MDEAERARAEILKRVAQCGALLPRLFERIDEVLELPDLTEAEKLAIESLPALIGSSYEMIRKAFEATRSLPYEELRTRTDCLHEHLVASFATFNQMLRPKGN
jgi:hypothetical protein